MKRIRPVYENGLTWTLMLCVSLVCVAGIAADVPAVLPRPNKTPPSDGKVKVYILAGQSNMVGFGYLQGAQPVYPSIYLSADPNIKVGRMPVGPSALLRHGVYQTAERDAPKGAKVALNFVINYEEGGESCLLHGDNQSEHLLSDIIGATPMGKFLLFASLFEIVPLKHETNPSVQSENATPTWRACTTMELVVDSGDCTVYSLAEKHPSPSLR